MLPFSTTPTEHHARSPFQGERQQGTGEIARRQTLRAAGKMTMDGQTGCTSYAEPTFLPVTLPLGY